MILVIGYGNTLRSDDGVGAHVAQEVEAQGWPGVLSISAHQLVPELAAELAQAALVIFVDAVEGDAQAGVQALDLSAQAAQTPAAMTPAAMTHHVTPQSLLQLAQLLYSRRPQAILVPVPGENFELGEGLSRLALQGADAALRLIGLQVARHFEQETHHA